MMLQLHVDRQVDTRVTQTDAQQRQTDGVCLMVLPRGHRPCVRPSVRRLSASPRFSQLLLSKRRRGDSAAGACWERELLLSW